MERLWLAPTFLDRDSAGPRPGAGVPARGAAASRASASCCSRCWSGSCSGSGSPAASAFATVTNKPWRPRAVRAAIVPLLVGLPMLGAGERRRRCRRIHDISTDPQGSARVHARGDRRCSMNKDPRGRGGARWSRGSRRAAIPTSRRCTSTLPPDQAFARAKAVAERMPGWDVTHADAESGPHRGDRHLAPVPLRGRRRDSRAARRHGLARGPALALARGQSDLGTNAARIRAFGARSCAKGELAASPRLARLRGLRAPRRSSRSCRRRCACAPSCRR